MGLLFPLARGRRKRRGVAAPRLNFIVVQRARDDNSVLIPSEALMKTIVIDGESQLVGEHFAVIYVPGKKRKRFPENCVQVMASEEAALSGGNAEKNLYAAKVVGPSRSSEGFRLFHLLRWLD